MWLLIISFMLGNTHVKDYTYVKCQNMPCIEYILDMAFESDKIISIKIYKDQKQQQLIYYQ